MTSKDQCNSSSVDVKITRMLLYLSAVSVLCLLPEMSVAYVHMFVPDFEVIFIFEG